jgi:hypothetical protein
MTSTSRTGVNKTLDDDPWDNPAFTGVVTTTHSTLDDGAGNATVGGALVVDGNTALLGHLSVVNGFGVWNVTAPTSQPTRAVTLDDVIAVLVAYGLTA